MAGQLIDKDQRKYMLLGLRIAGDFGAVIAVPVILFVLIGRWLDAKYSIAPWATVGAFVLSALVSGRSINQKAKVYGKQFAALDSKKDDTII